ncbi:SigB/SigF/SigG family RNA polymerase sigma factor [Streptomyces johnsoniae]|uniref:SigB/SigF/SigG family RNA polymerase sigma factor n=1 Tax=Streptomyces johnsoniae TaxID=3075532 RepID=A0ABU2S8D2_9ACTN|nr:SigB/SigF/SigG family RNA polymerase sigma factor [Streptomyces sp. DSM 41886]MDT0445238.1 SigB/SigF/SigG family RNA polymerase sigma factor [Streptomyces sp. DSM 41886]
MRTSTRTTPRTKNRTAPRTTRRGATRPAPPRPRRRRHPHDDAPDTGPQFERIAALPDGPERRRLCDEVVSAWLPMADRLARNFRDRGESQEDLAQVAALGLVKAVRGYDPHRGNAFESYAVPTIVGEVKRHFRDHLWGLHVPRRTQELRNRVRAAQRSLECRVDDRPPGVAALAEAGGLTQEEVREGMAALESYRPLSLDADLSRGGDGGYSLADTVGGPDAGYERVVRMAAVRPKLRALSERERHLLYLRFYRELTQREIGARLGISQMHVSRLLNRICARIHDEIEADGGVPGRP